MGQYKPLIDALRTGANEIEKGYWYRGRNNGDEEVCVFADKVVTSTMAKIGPGGCLVTATMKWDSYPHIARYLNLTPYKNELAIYKANDSQSLEDGRQWAIDTLRGTADMLESEDEQH